MRPTPTRIPSYRLHKSSGRAVVTIDRRDVFLGRHGTPESRRKYDRIISEWIGAGRQLPVAAEDLTIIELIARFWTYAESTYRKRDGTPSTELDNFKQALRPLKALYADTPARLFGPRSLRGVQSAMIRLGWCRKSVNKQISRVRLVFKWATAHELIPASVYHGLITIDGLRRGRTDAPESDPVRPVPEPFIDAMLPHVGRQVAAIIRLQLLTGMRPGEVIAMRGCDIDTSGRLWLYTPAEHKTAHHGHTRTIYLGPQAIEVLKPFLRVDVMSPLFSPAEAEAERRAAMHAARTTPMSYGNAPGTNRRPRPQRRPDNAYSVASYRRAIARGCDRADAWAKGGAVIGNDERIIPRWHPHQLRHNAATFLRKQYGLEAAQVILGHKTLSVTEIYAEKNVEAAMRIMAEVG